MRFGLGSARRPPPGQLGIVLAAVAGSVACAGSRLHAGRVDGAESESMGWKALADGRPVEAEASFAQALARSGGDPIARLGRATVAYERGNVDAAVDDSLAALAELAAPGGWTDLLAPLAAGRLAVLYDELSVEGRDRVRQALQPERLARSVALPWPARLELARLAEHAARVGLDADRLDAEGAAAGCARFVFDAGRAGALPRLDLDAPAPPSLQQTARWRPLEVSGCRVDLPTDVDRRAGVRVLRAAIEVSAGPYAIVVDYPAEARLSVDGGAAVAHGSPDRYGPGASAFALTLARGRHELELRIASEGGAGELTWLVLPGKPDGPVHFVDPRTSGGPPPAQAALVPVPLVEPPIHADQPGLRALADYAAAYGAARVGAYDRALEAASRLRARPAFALGLALAGAISRVDPTRPGSFARDDARRGLRAAVAVDPGLARPFVALAGLELDDDRPREAIEAARAAVRAAPGWWSAELALARALAARGLDLDAERSTLAAGEKAHASDRPGAMPCPLVEALRRRAEDRRIVAEEPRWMGASTACGGDVGAEVERLRNEGDLAAAIALARRALRADPARGDLAADLSTLLGATNRGREAIADLVERVAREPADPTWRLRLADAQVAAGRLAEARSTLAALVAIRPDLVEARRAARALGVPLPIDGYRVDGRAAIRAFESAAERYAGPAVVVLDRAVTVVLPGGGRLTLTHEIVRVDSKEAIDRWGEVTVPPGAEILTLRTHKPDGSTREPEEIAGKETISAADLAIGDYLECELFEAAAPAAPFAPGFLAERFYFQSFDAPLARSELVLVTPADLPVDLDRRGAAPAAETRVEPNGTRVTRFAATHVPQLFAERAAVLPVEYVPSVRASSGVSWQSWARYVADELADAERSSPGIRAAAREIAAGAGREHGALAQAIVAFVTERIEASDTFAEPASHTLARGHGSRVPLALALARELGVPARPVLARSRLVAETGAATPPQELDDFGDALVEFDLPPATFGGGAGPVFADLRLRHAAFGYLPPGLDGARTLGVPDGRFAFARSRASEDRRTVDMTIRLDDRGGGVATAREELSGWPALEWAELVDRVGTDRVRLRQDFEQRWLGVQFPGARLGELEVELARDGAGRVGGAHVRYSFASARLASAVARGGGEGREIRIEPTFFRSQPGRRFAAEPRRATALVLGFDVPVRLTATVELPPGARLEADALRRDTVVARAGGYRFVEEREVRPGPAGRANVLVLRRESTLPLMRVAPGDYPAVAADLRRVDGLEQDEIRIPLGPGQRGAAR